ncbi:MAG: nucleotidyltransferase domain-containing protein [Chloroflexi bacterium]|nr:nucleotidyltransferase domain-containing protein [Chloroflexota bacterium]
MNDLAIARRVQLEAALPGIVERLVAIGAKKVILFGSLVTGRVAATSDIDLIVVLDRPGRFADRLGAVYDAMESPVAVDALVYTTAELDELAQSRTFVRQAVREGRVLHAS